jgi:hypothetical protein
MGFFDGVFLMGDLAITFFFNALGCFDSALLMGDFAIVFLRSDVGVFFFVWGLVVGDFGLAAGDFLVLIFLVVSSKSFSCQFLFWNRKINHYVVMCMTKQR